MRRQMTDNADADLDESLSEAQREIGACLRNMGIIL